MAGTLLVCWMFVVVCFLASRRLVPVFKTLFMARLYHDKTIKTYFRALMPAAKKHCDNLSYFSVLCSMKAIYSRYYKAEKKYCSR